MLTVDPHPLLDLRAFITRFSKPVGHLETTPFDQLTTETTAPVSTSDKVRLEVRNLLRHGGFKPTGRNKPASEYLLKAVDQQLLSPINAAVDTCNVVSFHSGLPISVVDLSRATAPLRVGIAPDGSEYVFNLSGQILKLDGLLCLFDADGACANAVKDAQRTKTDETTVETLSLIWGTTALPGHAATTEEWYHRLLTDQSAEVVPVELL